MNEIDQNDAAGPASTSPLCRGFVVADRLYEGGRVLSQPGYRREARQERRTLRQAQVP